MGTLSAGYIADLVVQVGTRWNGGVYEPEFRLWLLVVATVLATGSFVALGLSIEMGLVLYVPVAWLGVQTVGVSFAMSAVFTVSVARFRCLSFFLFPLLVCLKMVVTLFSCSLLGHASTLLVLS